MKRVITSLILLTILMPFLSLAQNSLEENLVMRNDLDMMFKHLDKSKVPSGYLRDYAVEITDLSQYEGKELTDSNIVTFATYKDILKSFKSARVRNVNMGGIPDFIENYPSRFISGNLHFSVAFFQYDAIKANALSDGLIGFDGSRVYDSYSGIAWQNPYESVYLFAFAPNSQFAINRQVTFTFDGDLLFKNMNFRAIQFDAGDGLGFKNLIFNTPFRVLYSSWGTKELKLRILTNSGETLIAHSVIHICQEIPVQSRELEPQGLPIFEETYEGVNVAAKVSYLCAPGHSSITKPLIFVEGFDPWELSPIIGDEEESNTTPDKAGFTTFKQFFSGFQSSNLAVHYDFVYIDWYNSTEDILANSKLLIKIIQNINAIKAAAGSTEKNVVLGYSMGGLVARHALKTMENNNIAHETETYISFDSPHLGANVPLGGLYFIRQLFSMIHGFQGAINLADLFTDGLLSEAEETIYNVLHSMAARQMLVNYVTPDGILSHFDHENFQEELLAIGFPEGDSGTTMERLAIVNGREYNYRNSWYDNKYILYANGNAKSSILTDLVGFLGNIMLGFMPGFFLTGIDLDFLGSSLFFLGSTTIDFKAEVFPYTSTALNNNKLAYTKLSMTKKFLWLFPKTYKIFESTNQRPQESTDNLYYDEFPSSTYELDSVYTHLDSLSYDSSNWGTYRFQYAVTDKISLMPVASALCIKNGDPISSAYYKRDYFSMPPVPRVTCPFDAFMLSDKAMSHIDDDGIWSWIDGQLNMKIVGPDRIVEEGNYTVSGITGNIQWSTSDSEIATIDNSGKLQAAGKSGRVTITAETYISGKMYRKTKDVIVNFPDIVLSATYNPGEGFRFTASTVDIVDKVFLDSLVSDGVVLYQWTMIDEDGTLTTQTLADNHISILPEENKAITVTVRLIDTDGNQGELKSLSYNIRTPFSLNYKYVVVNSEHTAYFVKENGTYDINGVNEDFSIRFLHILTPNDNILNGMIDKYIKGDVCYISYISPNSSNLATYWMTGTRTSGFLSPIWTFNFFDSTTFLQPLNYVINNPPEEERTMYVFRMTILNSEEEAMQTVPFTIIYKPEFPSTE